MNYIQRFIVIPIQRFSPARHAKKNSTQPEASAPPVVVKKGQFKQVNSYDEARTLVAQHGFSNKLEARQYLEMIEEAVEKKGLDAASAEMLIKATNKAMETLEPMKIINPEHALDYMLNHYNTLEKLEDFSCSILLNTEDLEENAIRLLANAALAVHQSLSENARKQGNLDPEQRTGRRPETRLNRVSTEDNIRDFLYGHNRIESETIRDDAWRDIGLGPYPSMRNMNMRQTSQPQDSGRLRTNASARHESAMRSSRNPQPAQNIRLPDQPATTYQQAPAVRRRNPAPLHRPVNYIDRRPVAVRTERLAGSDLYQQPSRTDRWTGNPMVAQAARITDVGPHPAFPPVLREAATRETARQRVDSVAIDASRPPVSRMSRRPLTPRPSEPRGTMPQFLRQPFSAEGARAQSAGQTNVAGSGQTPENDSMTAFAEEINQRFYHS